MAAPVNLNRVRKARARAEDKARAERNAAAHGRSKADKEIERARAEKAGRDLDGHRTLT